MFTVTNLGTSSSGGFGWFRAIYDDRFIFDDGWNFEGTGLGSINPLAAPQTGAVAIEVPLVVAESDESLAVRFINMQGTEISYVIRPGAEGSDPPVQIEMSHFAHEILGTWFVLDGGFSEWFEGGEVFELFEDGTGIEMFENETWHFTWSVSEPSIHTIREDGDYFELEAVDIVFEYDDITMQFYASVWDDSILSRDAQGTLLLLFDGTGPPIVFESISGQDVEEATAGQGAAVPVDWRTVYNAHTDMGVGFSINIPSTWRHQLNVAGYDMEIDAPFGWFTIADVILSPSIFEEWVFDGNISWENFQFDDGHSGYMVTHQNHIVWARDSGLRLYFHHEGWFGVYFDNEDTILRMARSLAPL